MRPPSRLLLVATTAALALAASPSLATGAKEECIASNAKAQDLRRDGKLSLAREQLHACMDAACPAMVRSDCARRLDEVDTAQPTVVFEVKDGAGGDVVGVKLTVDGKLLTASLAGTAVPLDPGAHVATFEAAGQAPVTRTLVITEGQKGRHERVVLGASRAPVAPVSPDGGGMGTQRVLGLVSGGVGVAGVAVGAVFGLMMLSAKSDQEKACGVTCPSTAAQSQAASDHSSAQTDGAVSTAGFIAGGALLVGGVVAFLTAPRSDRAAGSALRVAPSVGPGAGGVILRGEF